MKKMLKTEWLSLVITPTIFVISFVLFGACDGDNGTAPPEFGSISGTVKFIGSPPTTGDVQVSIWPSWPPAGPPAAATDPLDPGVATQSYKIEGISKGTYEVVTVGWRDPANPAGALVLGVYWAETDSVGVDSNGSPNLPVQPIPIVISDNNLDITGVDIKANLDIAP